MLLHLCLHGFNTMPKDTQGSRQYSVKEQMNECNLGEQIFVNHSLSKYCTSSTETLLYTKKIFAEKCKAKAFPHSWRTIPYIMSPLKTKKGNAHSPEISLTLVHVQNAFPFLMYSLLLLKYAFLKNKARFLAFQFNLHKLLGNIQQVLL